MLLPAGTGSSGAAAAVAARARDLVDVSSSERIVFKQYPNYCVDKDNNDIGANPHAEIYTYQGCEELCTGDAACLAFEYRGEGGLVEPVKCWFLPGTVYGDDFAIPVAGKVTNNSAKIYTDATCSVKMKDKICPLTVPDAGDSCANELPCDYDPVTCDTALDVIYDAIAECTDGAWKVSKGLAKCPTDPGPLIWPTSSSRTCSGHESQSAPCPDLPVCSECVPRDCAFDDWADWSPQGGCTGLETRKRSIATANNICGTPCTGPQIETKTIVEPTCSNVDVDCKVGDWSMWSVCNDDFDQKVRLRSVTQPPQHGGRGCAGTMKETKPCGEVHPPVDCEFGDWGMWTQCTVTCGGGYQTSMRVIESFAENNGSLCVGEMRTQRICNDQPCGESVDCKLGDWSEWHGCSGDSMSQRTRHREIATPASDGGAPCADQAMEETKGCLPKVKPEDCQLSEWGDWSKCTASCDGGQRTKSRILLQQPQFGGDCAATSLSVTEACAEKPCFPDEDCALSDWGEWSGCEKCGNDVQKRSRFVTHQALTTGATCASSLVEVLTCPHQDECETDCVWDDWDTWSACTTTCGGGSKRRTRQVLASPVHGGKKCEDYDKQEVGPCNTQNCLKCVDGTWGDWRDWTQCSATCDVGLKSRHRDVATHPNECGVPVVGVEDEYATCRTCKKAVPANSEDPSVPIGRGDRVVFKHFTNYCVNKDNKDLDATGHLAVLTFAGCQELCAEDEACLGFEYRAPGGAPEPIKCWTFRDGSNPPVAGKVTSNNTKLWSDAKCQVKVIDKVCPKDLPADGDSCSNTLPCHYDPISCDGESARRFTTSAQCIHGAWHVAKDLTGCSTDGVYTYYDSYCVDANNMNVGLNPMPDISEEWACKQLCNTYTACTAYEFAQPLAAKLLSPPAQCWISPGTKGGKDTHPAVKGVKTYDPDLNTYSTGCVVKKVQDDCPELLPSTGDDCSTVLREEACDFEPYTCPDGITAYTASSTCVDGKWKSVQHDIQCASCPAVPPAQNTDCTKDSLCYYHKQTCMNGGKYYTTTAECQGGKWVVLAGHGCDSGVCPDGETIEPCTTVRDCELSDWSSWSDCSCSCFGVRERHRNVAQYPAGGGLPCMTDALREIEQCKPGIGDDLPEGCDKPDPRACEFDDWSEWSECPVTCSGSQTYRERAIMTPSAFEGAACNESMREMKPCAMIICPDYQCLDCLWGDWEEWSDCSKCGDQRTRNRKILRMANDCGTRCDEKLAMEVSNCTSPCELEEYYCSWTDWSSATRCSAPCGPSTRIKQRTLEMTADPVKGVEPLFFSQRSTICSGTQTLQEKCEDVPACKTECEPVDCALSDWGPWGDCACTQLRDRHRIVDTTAACGGKVCNGTLAETERCENSCEDPEPCTFTEWGDWSVCTSSEDQASRSRMVDNVDKNGGHPCDLPTEETMSCAMLGTDPTTDCEFSDWRDWSDCTRTCDVGTQSKSRNIMNPSVHGGAPCIGDLEVVKICTLEKCEKVDCVLEDWGDWGACSSYGQASRSRDVETEAQGDGTQCVGSLKEAKACDVTVDCEVTDWSDWDKCSSSCAGGQNSRHRTIHAFPRNGGFACPASLQETQGCNVESCAKTDCEMGDWAGWSDCSATCGIGSVSRERSVAQYASEGGRPCADSGLVEYQDCQEAPCETIDCKWGDWLEWSDCSITCGGGQKTRLRHIETTPAKGGKICAAHDKEQVEPCNTLSCDAGGGCVDAAWEDWSEWTQCSSSCRGGYSWRNRRVQQEANFCGDPAVGMSHEMQSCNDDVHCSASQDCELGTWDDWSPCAQDCGGTQQRVRSVEHSAQGKDAKPCAGSLQEVKPCTDSGTCKGPEPQDCVVADWGTWSPCSASCGKSGSAHRARTILTQPLNGGKQCPGVLGEMAPCNDKPCEEACKPEDGAWGDWGDWGGCDKCGGQRHRYRQVETPSACGGAPLEAGDSEMVSNCTRSCHAREYCSWTDWQPWESCHATCGQGVRSRTRTLTSLIESEVVGDKAEGSDDSYAEAFDLKAHVATRLSPGAPAHAVNSMHGTAWAFATGGLTCLLGIGVVHLVSKGLRGGLFAGRTSYRALRPYAAAETELVQPQGEWRP